MKKHKVKGFMTLQGVLMVILLGLLSLSFLQIYGSQFSALTANRHALQAQQFAQSEADVLRNTSYDHLAAAVHGKRPISGGNGWQSLVLLSGETTVNNVKQRLATIQVFRNSTVISPDFSLQVPLSSRNGGKVDWDNGYAELADGLIMQWGTSRRSSGEYCETFNFPRPFPKACLSISGTVLGVDQNLNWGFSVLNRMQYQLFTDNGGGQQFWYIAVGR